MNGIHLENIDKMIKVNDINKDEVKRILNEINKGFEELSSSYSGNSISFAFEELQRQQQNIAKIEKVIANYSNILNSVKNSYITQDLNTNSIINSANSQI